MASCYKCKHLEECKNGEIPVITDDLAKGCPQFEPETVEIVGDMIKCSVLIAVIYVIMMLIGIRHTGLVFCVGAIAGILSEAARNGTR